MMFEPNKHQNTLLSGNSGAKKIDRNIIKQKSLENQGFKECVTCLGFEPRTPSLKGMCSTS